MNYKEWRELYMEKNSIDESDLKMDTNWEKDIKELYEKAREG